jgi:hypothetical protein
MAYKNCYYPYLEKSLWKPKSQEKYNTNRSSTTHQAKTDKTKYKTRPEKKLDKNTSKHKEYQPLKQDF